MNDNSSSPGSKRTRRLAADSAGIGAAAELLRAGGTVAFPTETVYGLGADATTAEAVAGIFAAKERPRFNPLICHVATVEAALREGVLDAWAQRLAEAFWPGPLTLVVPLSPDSRICDLARAGLPSVGLRVPDHASATALLAAVDRPIAAPSANRSGHVSPTTAGHVLADLDGRIDAVIDGGPTRVGLESTVVACLDGAVRLLRAGGVTRAALQAVLGQAPEAATAAIVSPGMLAAHYAPATRLRLDARDIRPGEAALLFGPEAPAGAARAGWLLNLSPGGDLTEAAARLFSHLRQLDDAGADAIAVAPIPQEGLGEAINDRLRRAAAGR
jgi:L-threonylcarbamoyladenylate synthase